MKNHNQELVRSLIEISKIHEKRLNFALTNLAEIFPIDEEKFSHLSDEEFLLVELLTNRFSKLQDFIGSKLINVVLDKLGEFKTDLTMIDKINKLEKFHHMKNADLWQVFRELRNHLSHEYPDNPALFVTYLNKTYVLSSELLNCLTKLLEVIDFKDTSIT